MTETVWTTADGVEVTESSVVFWIYNPDMEFHPVSAYLAIPVSGGVSEPMCEMYGSQDAAKKAREQ